MGTNYYLCKRDPQSLKDYHIIHIGKCSAGWKFGFQRYRDIGLTNFEAYKKEIESPYNVIFNEYDERVTPDDLLKIIEEHQQNEGCYNFAYDDNVDGYRFSDNNFC